MVLEVYYWACIWQVDNSGCKLVFVLRLSGGSGVPVLHIFGKQWNGLSLKIMWMTDVLNVAKWVRIEAHCTKLNAAVPISSLQDLRLGTA